MNKSIKIAKVAVFFFIALMAAIFLTINSASNYMRPYYMAATITSFLLLVGALGYLSTRSTK